MDVLESQSITAILGISKINPSQTTVVTYKLQDVLLENFFQNILVKYVTEEELNELVKKKEDAIIFGDAFDQLTKKYPVLNQEFKKSFTSFKIALLKEKVEENKTVGVFFRKRVFSSKGFD